jgi:hypothetical protein
MKCPVCHQEMDDGFIPVVREALHFVPNKAGIRNFFALNYGINTIPLTKPPGIRHEKAEGFYCPNCKMVFLPVKDLYIK